MQLGGGTVRPDVIRVGGIELDDKEKSVMLDGEPVALTPTEYEILKLLIQNPGQVFSPKEIYTRIWNDLPLGQREYRGGDISGIYGKSWKQSGRTQILKSSLGTGIQM